jgi:hypothetical protein
LIPEEPGEGARRGSGDPPHKDPSVSGNLSDIAVADLPHIRPVDQNVYGIGHSCLPAESQHTVTEESRTVSISPKFLANCFRQVFLLSETWMSLPTL